VLAAADPPAWHQTGQIPAYRRGSLFRPPTGDFQNSLRAAQGAIPSSTIERSFASEPPENLPVSRWLRKIKQV